MPSSLQILFYSVFRFRLDNAQFTRERHLMNHWFCSSLAYFGQFILAVTSVALQTLRMKLYLLVKTLVPSISSCGESKKRAVKETGIQQICALPFVYLVCWEYMHEKSSVKDATHQLQVLLCCRYVCGSLFCPCPVLPCLQFITKL